MENTDYMEIYDGARVLATDEARVTETLITYEAGRNNYKKYKSITMIFRRQSTLMTSVP